VAGDLFATHAGGDQAVASPLEGKGQGMKGLLVLFLVAGGTLPLLAADCVKVLGAQKADAASLERVEDAWNEAFIRGNTDYLECLLVPDFVTVTPHGRRDRAWELEHARQNRGSTAPIPHFSGTVFQIDGSTGIAKLYKPGSADGQHPATQLADVFTFQDGEWRAVYSQHTFVEGK